MKSSRRSFFTAIGIAPAIAAGLPEPAEVTAIKPDPQKTYILTYPEALTDEQFERLRTAWKEAFAGNSPKMMLLEGGLQFVDPSTPVVNITINTLDSQSFEDQLRRNAGPFTEALTKGLKSGQSIL